MEAFLKKNEKSLAFLIFVAGLMVTVTAFAFTSFVTKEQYEKDQTLNRAQIQALYDYIILKKEVDR